MSTRIRIAWFGHGPDRRGNGLVTYSREVPRALRGAGAEIVFFYHRRSPTLVVPKAIPLRALRWRNQDVLSTPGSHRRVALALDTTSVDVGHVSLAFSLTMDAWLPYLFHRRQKPIVATLHFPFGRARSIWAVASWLVYAIYLPILARYDGLIVLSEGQRRILVQAGLKPARIHVVPNAVDVHRYKAGPSTYKEAIGARWLAVYSGRLDPEKRADVLLEVFHDLPLPADHKLVLMGDGTQRKALQKRYWEDPRIVFTGHIADEKERIRILRAADAFVLPSDVEGLSLALLEAMACGLAPIATDAGADGEVVRGVGIVVRSNRLREDLRDALLALAGQFDLCREMGQRARAKVVQHHSLDQLTARLVRLYAGLMEEYGRTERP
ncbi:MAG: glycosyltransferase family 4 protein [Anaerolineae bacterium]